MTFADLTAGDAVFLDQVHDQLGMAQEFGILGQEMFAQEQEFGVLGREMVQDLLNVMIGAHGRVVLLISLEFRFSSEHILTNHNDGQENQLQKCLRSPGNEQGNDRGEQAKNGE